MKHGTNPLQVELYHEERSDVAYSCFLCGLCDALCPLQLKPSEMFRGIRREAVIDNAVFLLTYEPWLADAKHNLYSLYRSAYGIDYSAMQKPKARIVLFPGCALGTFHPTLTKALYDNLSACEFEFGMLLDCCYKPLDDLGLQERFDKALVTLRRTLDDMGVEEIITACPSCQQFLGRSFKDRKVISCYELIAPIGQEDGRKLTIHDSCSDRLEGRIGAQVRSLLSKTRSIVEMEHNRLNTICCGSGGLVSAYDPELARHASRRRIQEAERIGAETMVTYCAACANALFTPDSSLEVRHSLELLLDVKEDYGQIRVNIEKLLSGSQGRLLKLIKSSP